MKLRLTVLAVTSAAVFLSAPALADKALMLTPAEEQKLVQFVARGLADHPEDAAIAVYLLNKIGTAGTVTEHKDAPAPKPADKPTDEGAPQ